MLDGIQAKAVAMGLIHHPARPVFDFLGDGVITKIDIFSHQIIKITQLIINLIVPAFAGVIVNDFENAVFGGILYMVNAAEAFEIPNELRVLACAGREGVARPAFAFDNLIVYLRAIFGVNALDADLFFLIRAHFVVNHHVQQYGNIIVFQRVNRRQQLVFIAVFGGDGSLLVEFAQIKQIVGVIANGIAAGRAFIGWGQPYHIDADIIESACAFGKFGPELAAIRVIPVEVLQ